MPNMRSFCAGILAASATFAVGVSPALAHGGEALTKVNALMYWSLKFDIVTVTLLVLLVYGIGILRRGKGRNAPVWWRHLVFVVGVLVLFVALQSPIDAIAERSFWVHQIQHLLLRMVGPMLIALAVPDGVLTAGLPGVMRRFVIKPLASSTGLRHVAHFFSHPLVVFVVFVWSIYFWQIPSIHDAALTDPVLHYTMHVTMIFAGVIFFRVIFDRRLPPASLGFGYRQVMLIAAVMSTIFLGAVTALKSEEWYSAYDIHGRLFAQTGLMDEQIGGFVIWVPGSMMLIIAILLTIYAWNRTETAQFSSRDGWISSNMSALQHPQTEEELWIKVEKPNRAVAFALGAVTVSIFVLLMSTMVINASMQ
ncbi:MAG: cytochrome c oxidase assembly protein [Alphaproteobacteria bacterium]|nr:cytochrome c oxidase assembly protein [Alphaproteobacteria bacterium]